MFCKGYLQPLISQTAPGQVENHLTHTCMGKHWPSGQPSSLSWLLQHTSQTCKAACIPTLHHREGLQIPPHPTAVGRCLLPRTLIDNYLLGVISSER
jgi:hypothetical protein